MFLALLYSLIIHQTVTFANPYHKYPYAFLLDIGNEELQTNSKQFRVSVPGGSLALRYPAIGEEDIIAHVRVTGIDFDNVLKANIVDGGPGYKYVVIVFMGNPDKAYDAVITVSTLDNEAISAEDADQAGTDEVKASYKVVENEEDANDSAETQKHQSDGNHEQLPSASNFYNSAENSDVDSNDSAEIEQQRSDGSHEQLPSASNFYDSAENLDVNGKEDESDSGIYVNSGEALRTEEDIRVNSSDDADDVQDYAETNDQKENNDYDDAPKAERYNVNEDYDTDENQAPSALDSNLYDKYKDLRPHFYDYAVAQASNNANEVDYNDDFKGNVVYAPEDPVELDQMFNDEEVHNDREKYNNYANDNSAVAY